MCIPELADLPVIFISGYRRDKTVAKALESGAADYLVKPFSVTELVARVRAALRRREEREPFVGDLAIDYAHRRVTVGGESVDLTATEYELLRVPSLDTGRAVTVRDAAAAALGQVGPRRREPRAQLRHEPAAQARRQRVQPRHIFNERSVGYRMDKPPGR